MVSIATSMAQVFSENAVGYYVRDLVQGFNLVANQLNNAGGDNRLNVILPDGDQSLDSARLLKWDSELQTFAQPITYFNGGGWLNADFSVATASLEPGEAAFLRVPAPTSITLVGEVPQGNLAVELPVNFSLVSQPTPQALALDAAGDAIPAGDNDRVLFWDDVGQTYENPKTFFVTDPVTGDGVWLNSDFSDADMSVAVGEGFFYRRNTVNGPTSWDRSFSVN
jgi:hypothetical protein